VRRGADTGDSGIFKRHREMVEKRRHSVRETEGCEDARAKERVTAQGIEEGILGSGKIRVNP
jgi:hypothetical protein